MTGVIYLGRIPHGFYETEMKSYFSQFGTVERISIPRNKKTGRFKHFAFIEFQDEKVAKIAQETMDNYLLMNHQLVCKMVNEIPDNLCSKKFKFINWVKKEALKRSKSSLESRKARINSKMEEKNQKMKDLGIDYSF